MPHSKSLSQPSRDVSTRAKARNKFASITKISSFETGAAPNERLWRKRPELVALSTSARVEDRLIYTLKTLSWKRKHAQDYNVQDMDPNLYNHDQPYETDDQPPNKKARLKIGARASIACANCRRRKVRCSGEYPNCTFCSKKNWKCEYDGHPLDTSHPSNNNSPSYATLPGQAFFNSNGSFSEKDQSFDPKSLYPPLDILNSALESFFNFMIGAGLFNFIHRPSFEVALAEGTAEPELVLPMLALSARFCTPLAELHGRRHTVAASFYATAAMNTIRMDPGANLSLTRLQALLMLALHDCTEGEESRGWVHLGMAIRMCQIQRLSSFEHPDDGIIGEPPISTSSRNFKNPPPQDLPPTSGASNPIESEMRRRTFWCTFLLDRMLCDGNTRPSVIRFDPYPAPIRMPRLDADYFAGRWGLAARFEERVPPWARSATALERTNQSEPEPDLFGWTLRIVDLWSKVASYIARGGRNVDRRVPWDESAFRTLDTALREWNQSLPEELHYTEKNVIGHSIIEDAKMFGLIHLLYFTAVLYLHRDYLPFQPPEGTYDPADGPVDGEPLYPSSIPEPSGWWAASAHEAFAAANAITELVRSLENQGAPLWGHPFCGFAVLTAATMHAHLFWFRKDEGMRINAHEFLFQDAKILVGFRKYWSIAKQWCQSLNRLYDLYGHARELGRSVRPHGTRKPISQMRDGVMYLLQEMPPVDPEDANLTDNDPVDNGSATCSSDPPSPRAPDIQEISKATPQSSERHASILSHTRKRHDLFSLLNPVSPVSENRTPTPVALNQQRPYTSTIIPIPEPNLNAHYLETVNFGPVDSIPGYEIPMENNFDLWSQPVPDFNLGDWGALFGPGGWWQSGTVGSMGSVL